MAIKMLSTQAEDFFTDFNHYSIMQRLVLMITLASFHQPSFDIKKDLHGSNF